MTGQGCLIPFGGLMPMKNWVFQKDNYSKHTSRVAKSFLEKSVPKLLSWPANVLDLNPIENVWHMLKRAVESRNPASINGLKQ